MEFLGVLVLGPKTSKGCDNKILWSFLVWKTPKNSWGEVSKMYVLNPHVFFWNSPLLKSLPFNKLGNASQGNLQLGDIGYFGKFLKLGEKKCLVRWRQLNFLLHGTNQPYILVNQNNSTDSIYKYFLFLLFIILLWFFFLLDYNKIHKKQKFSAFDIVEPRSKEMRLVSYITCIDLIA